MSKAESETVEVAQEKAPFKEVIFSCPSRPDMRVVKRRSLDHNGRPIPGEEYTTVDIPFINGYAVATDEYELKLLSSGWTGLGCSVYREDDIPTIECPECAYKTSHRQAMQEHIRGHIVG